MWDLQNLLKARNLRNNELSHCALGYAGILRSFMRRKSGLLSVTNRRHAGNLWPSI